MSSLRLASLVLATLLAACGHDSSPLAGDAAAGGDGGDLRPDAIDPGSADEVLFQEGLTLYDIMAQPPLGQGWGHGRQYAKALPVAAVHRIARTYSP